MVSELTRLQDVSHLLEGYKSLVYSYNKTQFSEFLEKPESLVIMHHFLKRSNYFIGKAMEDDGKSATEISQGYSKNLNIESLRNQMPKE